MINTHVYACCAVLRCVRCAASTAGDLACSIDASTTGLAGPQADGAAQAGGADATSRLGCWASCQLAWGHDPIKMLFRDHWREVLLLFWFETWVSGLRSGFLCRHSLPSDTCADMCVSLPPPSARRPLRCCWQTSSNFYAFFAWVPSYMTTNWKIALEVTQGECGPVVDFSGRIKSAATCAPATCLSDSGQACV